MESLPCFIEKNHKSLSVAEEDINLVFQLQLAPSHSVERTHFRHPVAQYLSCDHLTPMELD